jgi:hypothetical protein
MLTVVVPLTVAAAAGLVNAAVGPVAVDPFATVTVRVAVAVPEAFETVSRSVCAPFAAVRLSHVYQNVVPVNVFVATTAPSTSIVIVFDVPHWFVAVPMDTLPLTVAPAAGLLNDAVRVGLAVLCVKVAVTFVAALIVTLHGLVPVHPPPLQPANVEPPADAAVSVTTVPAG